MPQMNKGGKFIFGESVIRPNGRVQLPTQAVDEYHIASEGKVYLFTGSKITGGFCVTRRGHPFREHILLNLSFYPHDPFLKTTESHRQNVPPFPKAALSRP